MVDEKEDKKTDMDVLVGEERKVKVAGKVLTVKEVGLGNQTKIFKILAEVLGEIGRKYPQMELDKTSFGDIILPIIEVAGEKLPPLLSLILDEDEEWLKENLKLKEEVEVISKFLEVNDLPFLISEIKRVIEKVKISSAVVKKLTIN